MKITEMTIMEIEEFIRDEFPETNLAMRCLNCDEYKPLSEMDLEHELCEDCQEQEDEEE